MKKNPALWGVLVFVIVAAVGLALRFGNSADVKGTLTLPRSLTPQITERHFAYNLHDLETPALKVKYEVFFNMKTQMKIEVVDQSNRYVATMCKPNGIFESMACSWTGLVDSYNRTMVPTGIYKLKISWGKLYEYSVYTDNFWALTTGV